MKLTKYNITKPSAIFKNIRIDYGLSKRIEFSYAKLTSKGDRWQQSDGVQCKLVELGEVNGVTQLGVYIGRMALVCLKGTPREGA